MEQNYFVIVGINALLKLITENSLVLNYIENLPGPCLACPRYTDWITEFLYNGQKNKSESKIIAAEEKKTMFESIALLINKYENERSDSS